MTMSNNRAFHQRLYDCLGKMVQERRKRLHMSQEDLAAEAHVDRAFISKIEGGKRQPSFGIVASIARGLHMSYARLVHKCEKCAEGIPAD